MRLRLLLIGMIFLAVFLPCVSAKDITMSVNQTDYYFRVGEQAIIPFEIDNTYDKEIEGVFTYQLTQQISQQGFQYTSSNSQSKTFTVQDGKYTISIGFGSSDTASTLNVHLTFSYKEKEEMIVDLGNIAIHFVEDDSQKQNKENPQQSKSQQANQQENKNTQQSGQNSLEQQMKKMQEEMNNMFNENNYQPQSNSMQQMQNNQLPQDSSSLRQEMQKQAEAQKKLEEEFQKNIAKNPEFQKEHQELLKEGFNLTGGNMDPDTNDTGDFQLEYKKSDDETAQLKGSMKNNTMQTLEKTTSEDIKKILETLHNSTKFQNYNSLLQKNGYMPGEIQVEKEGNKTKVTVPYSDEKNGSADIKSVIENNKVKEVRLEGFAKRSYWWLFLLIGIPIMAYMIYSRYFRQKKVIENKSQLVENQIDPKKEALILLEEAKRLFEERKEKDAYGKAAQAIRLYCSYKADLNCEMTNSELVKNMKKKRIKHEDVQKCLNLCSLVEFAKYQANKKDFDEIIERAEKVIK